MTQRRTTRPWIHVLAAWLLAACGGGSGNTPTVQIATGLPESEKVIEVFAQANRVLGQTLDGTVRSSRMQRLRFPAAAIVAARLAGVAAPGRVMVLDPDLLPAVVYRDDPARPGPGGNRTRFLLYDSLALPLAESGYVDIEVGNASVGTVHFDNAAGTATLSGTATLALEPLIWPQATVRGPILASRTVTSQGELPDTSQATRFTYEDAVTVTQEIGIGWYFRAHRRLSTSTVDGDLRVDYSSTQVFDDSDWDIAVTIAVPGHTIEASTRGIRSFPRNAQRLVVDGDGLDEDAACGCYRYRGEAFTSTAVDAFLAQFTELAIHMTQPEAGGTPFLEALALPGMYAALPGP